MKLLVLSDLHREHAEFSLPPELQYDAVILAGDIHSPGRRVVAWARSEALFGHEVPIIVVPGNHEFYGCTQPLELAAMREAASGTNVSILARDEVLIAEHQVRILGATLWTDFRLPIEMPNGESRRDVRLALHEANNRLNDFQMIDVPYVDTSRLLSSPRTRKRRATAEDTLAWHWTDRDWLEAKLTEPFDGKTVVVTHHAPTPLSVAARYRNDWLTPAFVSDLPKSFFDVPSLWVHGHTHTAFDYAIGACRVVSNPRGYRLKDSSFENPAFNPGFVIEV
ncbi:metallophosphoesterase [Pelomonas sp. SE-A7]|uniref:metallophosphoesterase n=1 Tax=Pelomonas sp. SE-A7 TaxID=3054953 RepID=UPI00259C9BDF|nr:metallophosphoesterase [Pelomonas sp. SE-A7]MDM4768312.1 metallophosphoesterase [Pelomonas sp. SE-A7]